MVSRTRCCLHGTSCQAHHGNIAPRSSFLRTRRRPTRACMMASGACKDCAAAASSQASASRRVRAGPGEHLGSVAVSAPFHASADLSWSVNARRSGNGSLRGFNSVVGSRCSMTCRSTRLNSKRAPRSPEGIRPASRCPINVERDSAESASEVCREHIGMPPLRRLEALESDTQ